MASPKESPIRKSPSQVNPQIIAPNVCVPGQLFEVMATAIPNGVDAGHLRLSVLLSPQLKPACNTALAHFPLFQDWPQTINNLAFQVMFAGMQTPIPVQPLAISPLDSNLWKAIFPPTLVVRQYQFDQGEHTNENKYVPLSLRERNLFRFKIKQDLYQKVAIQSPTKLPAKGLIIDRLEGAGILEKVPTGNPGQFDYRFRDILHNPMQELLLNRDRLIQRELQLAPGLNPQGGAAFPNLPKNLNLGTIQSRAVGQSGAVSKRRVPILRDSEHIQAATGMTIKQFEFSEFRAYMHKPDQAFIRSNLPGINDWKNIIDFHQIVASLGDYPEIMRRLGLVLDFIIPAAGVPATGLVSIQVTKGLPPGSLISPSTRFDRAQGFSPASGGNSEIQDGLLKFGRKDNTGLPLYDVVPGDVEGAMSKIDNFTKTILNPTAPGEIEEDSGFPALRSGGLSVAHAERDQWLDRIMTSAQQLNAQLKSAPTGPSQGSNIQLTAEHLVRGYRIDVRSRRAPDEPWGAWRSLCARHGLYYLGPNLPPVIQHQDEGWVALGLTVGETEPAVTSSGIEEDGVQERGVAQIKPGVVIPNQRVSNPGLVAILTLRPLLVYESLFRWVGWGLCVDRPYRSLPDPSLGPDCSAVPDPTHGNVMACSPIPGLNLMTAFVPVPGVLPRLRFGRQYQFRARIVDLAGNSRTLTDPMNPQTESQFATSDQDGYFDRFEPVPSPTLVLTESFVGAPSERFPEGKPLSPAESLSNLIIRTANLDPKTDPAMAPRIDSVVGSKAEPEHPDPDRHSDPHSDPHSDRHVVPPRISVELAEWHGLLDNLQTGKVGGVIGGKEAYDVIVSHDKTLSEQYGTPGAPEFFINPKQRPFITVPYLADPMAAGVTFVVHAPGTDPEAGHIVQTPFAGNWPDKVSFRLRLSGGNGAPQFNNGEMNIPVPIGEERIVLMSCFLKPGDEKLFGIWRWITERATPAQLNQLLPKVLQGRHWMITPYQELKLIHAVQQPVLNPQWVCIQVLPQASLGQAGAPACQDRSPNGENRRHRHLGETIATIDATMIIHRPSTQSLDLYARWREPIDQGVMLDDKEDPEQRWLYVEGKSSPFSVTIAYVPEGRGELVVARRLSNDRQVEGDDPEAEVPMSTQVTQDAKEMPIEQDGETPEPRLPDDSSMVPPEGVEENEIQSRGLKGTVAKTGPNTNSAQIQKQQPLTPIRPVVVQPQQPTGPPPFDETPFRCAPVPPPPPPIPRGIPAGPFRFQGLHRFGDTKYRCVAYKSVATSRYRHLFRPLPEKEGPNGPNFSRESPWVKADILNSSPPDSPKVLYIIPTFRWENTPQGHRRVGGGLRIYLDRPWFSSGDGEQLAVVLYPDPRAELPDNAKPYVSQWGLDPLWESKPFPPPPPDINIIIDDKIFDKTPINQDKSHTNPIGPKEIQVPQQQLLSIATDEISSRATPPVATQHQAQVRESDLKVGVTHPAPTNFKNAVAVRFDLRVIEAAIATIVCVFDVKPDVSRQLWYCDIDMDPGTAYFPFVRLALARYQVNSISGAHLSPVVLADFAQLVPERTASVVPDSKNVNQVIVTVVGMQGLAETARTSVVEMSVEEMNQAVPNDLGWIPVPGSKPIVLNRVNANHWSGPVPLPNLSSKQYRVVIKEFEVFNNTGEADTFQREERRLVYADALPLKR